MARENEARDEEGARSRRWRSPSSTAFGGRRSEPPIAKGGLSRAVATTFALAANVSRSTVKLKPQGMSWGLVLCIGSTIALGLLALINRPQLDDGAAYYAAAGVILQSYLVIDRRVWWPRHLIARGFLVLSGLVILVGIVNAYWVSAYALTKSNDPNRFLFTTTQDAMLAFDNRWCQTWKGHVSRPVDKSRSDHYVVAGDGLMFSVEYNLYKDVI